MLDKLFAASALAATILLTGAANAAAEPAIVATDLNVRSGPDIHCPRIATLPAGSSVEVYGCAPNNWCDIGWYRLRGWVSGDYLNWHGRQAYRAAPPQVIIVPSYPSFRSDRHHQRRYDDRRRHDDRRFEGRRDDKRHGDANKRLPRKRWECEIPMNCDK